MASKVKVLVVDDAAFMVKAITELLQADPDIEVIGNARNGQQGLEKIKALRPDVITLDMDMPVMDGLTSIRHMMIEAPVPIVVLSSLFKNGAVTFEALRLGVVDFMPKPSGAVSKDIHTAKQQLINRVKIAASINVHNIRRVKLVQQDRHKELTARYGFRPLEKLLVVGTTLGGPNTMIRLLSQLSPELPAAIIVTQEIAAKILPAFVKRFDQQVPWHIDMARDGVALEQGSCYIASNQQALTLGGNQAGAPSLQIGKDPERPLDTLFQSAAELFGERVVGLLLSGTGHDGAAGCAAIKKYNGLTMAQRTATCVYPNLTEHAIEYGVVDRVVLENQLAKEIAAVLTDAAPNFEASG